MAGLEIECIKRPGMANTEAIAIIEQAIRATWTALGPAADAEVSVVVSDDDEIRALNRQYRSKDTATNVLSFPQGFSETDLAAPAAAGPGLHLGDIVISWPTVKRESDAMGLARDHHLAHLTIHGFLHLLGYDHLTDAEAAAMEAVETGILDRLGIPDPYQSPDYETELTNP